MSKNVVTKRPNIPMQLSEKDVPWKCACGFLLGVLTPDKNTVRIKYKDLYLSVSGSDVKVTTLCRRCAAVNTIENSVTSQDVPEAHREAFNKEAFSKDTEKKVE